MDEAKTIEGPKEQVRIQSREGARNQLLLEAREVQTSPQSKTDKGIGHRGRDGAS